MIEPNQPKAADKPENIWISIGFNLFLPAIILSRLSDDARLGPANALLVALAFPVAYGVYDFCSRRKFNLFSILGFVSILLTGGLGLLKLDGFWFAVKEAAIPAILGVAILISLKTKYPLVRMLLFNEKIIDVPLVEKELEARNNKGKFDRLLVKATGLLACSFFLSALLNFFLTRRVLQSESGSSEFMGELSNLMWLSYPIIVIPCMIVMMIALWKLMSGIKELTGLDMEAIFKQPQQKKA
ncbi:MAG: VC0807 family protein [Opitutales bacterium]